MKVTLFDYGAGNLHSLAKALNVEGVEIALEEDPRKALHTDVLVLPGVGAFAAAADRLRSGRQAMREALENGLPCIGICLGMQLFFESSEEGPGEGLGLFAGTVTKIRARRVPQMGWNALEGGEDDGLFRRSPLPMAYYANSFVCRPQNAGCVVAWTTHETDRFPAAVRFKNTVGVQFHPEKSSAPGVQFLRQFLSRVSRERP